MEGHPLPAEDVTVQAAQLAEYREKYFIEDPRLNARMMRIRALGLPSHRRVGATTASLIRFAQQYSRIESKTNQDDLLKKLDDLFIAWLNSPLEQTSNRGADMGKRAIVGGTNCILFGPMPKKVTFIYVPPLISILSFAASIPDPVSVLGTYWGEAIPNEMKLMEFPPFTSITHFGLCHTVRALVTAGASCRKFHISERLSVSPLAYAVNYAIFHPGNTPFTLVDVLMGISQDRQFGATPGMAKNAMLPGISTGDFSSEVLRHVLILLIETIHYPPVQLVELFCGLLIRGHGIDAEHIACAEIGLAKAMGADFAEHNEWMKQTVIRRISLIKDILRDCEMAQARGLLSSPIRISVFSLMFTQKPDAFTAPMTTMNEFLSDPVQMREVLGKRKTQFMKEFPSTLSGRNMIVILSKYDFRDSNRAEFFWSGMRETKYPDAWITPPEEAEFTLLLRNYPDIMPL